MGYIRESYMMPRKVREALEGRFSVEVILEVFFAVDDYGRYWDTHRTGDGFDVSNLTPIAQGVFAMVLPLIEGYNADYIRRSNANTENALAGAEERQKKEERNRQRRERYVAKKSPQDEKYEMVKPKMTKKHSKIAVKPLHNKGLKESLPKIGDDEKSENSQSKMTKTVTKTTAKPLSDKAAEAKSAIAHRITGLNNSNSLHSLLLLEKGSGGKPFCAQGDVDKVEKRWIASNAVHSRNDGEGGGVDEMLKQVQHDRFGVQHDNFEVRTGSNPLGSLTGSKAEQTGGSAPVCGKGERGNKGSKGSEDLGSCGRGLWIPDVQLPVGRCLRNDSVGGTAEAVSGLRPSSARMVCAPTSRPTKGKASGQAPKAQGLPSAPHAPGTGEVLITKNFKIDFDDDVFNPYRRADRFLRQGVEKWLIQNKLGCCVEKKWIAKQIHKFAINQGKLFVLLGVEPDG